ncbi:hypothetical protein A20_1367 [Streptococcus pyogenes A20]|nr:hypothetical protein A20_1367 [Streptococcus pyogenes A20]
MSFLLLNGKRKKRALYSENALFHIFLRISSPELGLIFFQTNFT